MGVGYTWVSFDGRVVKVLTQEGPVPVRCHEEEKPDVISVGLILVTHDR